MELEVTWGRAIRVWWAYLWRSLLVGILGMIAGGIVGGIVGLILGVIGVPINVIKIVCGTVGVLIGLPISIIPMKMVLGKDFGEFKLVLLQKQQN